VHHPLFHRVTGAILRGQNTMLTVSTILNGEFGLQDVCLSVPCIVSAKGVEKIIESTFPEHELPEHIREVLSDKEKRR
jgi:L-lactate dehydrogenase